MNHLRISIIDGGLPFGGSSTLLLNLLRGLIENGIICQVICPEPDSPLRQEFEATGAEVRFGPSKALLYEDRIAWGWRALQDFQPHHAIGWLGKISFEMVRNLPTGIGRVIVAHADSELVYQAILPFAGECSAIACVSRQLVEGFRQRLLSGTSPELVYQPCGVASDFREENSEPNSDSLRIVYVGRIAREQKRIHLFPQIFRQLCESGIAFRWTIVGDGPDMALLRDSMASSRPDQAVVFTGGVAPDRVAAILREQDILLLTSDYEGLPLSVLEGMMSGLVPVVSDLSSGIRDVVAEGAGIRVPPDQIDGYATAIIELSRDRSRLAAMARCAQDRVRQEFSIASMAKRWINFLEALPQGERPVWPSKLHLLPLHLDEPHWRFHPIFRPLRRVMRHIAGRPEK